MVMMLMFPIIMSAAKMMKRTRKQKTGPKSNVLLNAYLNRSNIFKAIGSGCKTRTCRQKLMRLPTHHKTRNKQRQRRMFLSLPLVVYRTTLNELHRCPHIFRLRYVS